MHIAVRAGSRRAVLSLAVAAAAALALVGVPHAAHADSTTSTNPTIVVKSGSVHVNGRTFPWSKDDSCFESRSTTPLVSVSGSYAKIGTITQIASEKLDSAIIGYGDSHGYSAGIALCPTGSSLGFAFGNVVIGPTAVYLDSAVDDETADPTYTDHHTATVLIKPDSAFSVTRVHQHGRTTITATLRRYQLTGTGAWVRNTRQSVQLWQKNASGKFVQIKTASTGSSGVASFSFPSGKKHRYYVRYAGSSTVWSSASGGFTI